MKIVLDTNVLVSGLLNPFGPPGRILRMLSAGELSLCHDARILSEYEGVLSRAVFGFRRDDISALLEYVRASGETVAALPLPRRLPHRDDEPFLEVAIAGRVEYLITGNVRHFSSQSREGISVVSPASFIAEYQSRGT